MARSDDSGFYFNFSKHLSERHISISRIAKESGFNQSRIREIRSASKPVPARNIRLVIEALNSLAERGFEYPEINFDDEFRPESQLELSLDASSIDPLEYAALGLTNPQAWSANDSPDDFRLLTSKQVYAFLPRINQILERTSGDEAEFDMELERFQGDIQRLFDRVDQSLEVSFDKETSALDRITDDPNFRIVSGLEKTNRTLRKLESQDLIVDPIVETIGMFSIAVVGVLPLSFTKRTAEGDVVYRKISAMIWEYEYLSEDEKKTISFHIKADKLVAAIKAGVAHANNLLNGEED